MRKVLAILLAVVVLGGCAATVPIEKFSSDYSINIKLYCRANYIPGIIGYGNVGEKVAWIGVGQVQKPGILVCGDDRILFLGGTYADGAIGGGGGWQYSLTSDIRYDDIADVLVPAWGAGRRLVVKCKSNNYYTFEIVEGNQRKITYDFYKFIATKANLEIKPGFEKSTKEKGDYQPFKPQPPPISEPKQSEPKQSTKQPMLLKECGVPIWNIGDSWKFGSGEIKIIRIEENLYIAENSSSSDLVAYDRNTLEETFSIADKGGRVKIRSTFPMYFDFPLYVGKKWKRLFTARPSFLNKDYDYLMEYKVLCHEDITVSAGTFKAFKIEINHTNNESKGSGKAYIWYSPEVKLFVKVALDESSYWRFSHGCELMSFNLKDKEKSPKEIELTPEKVNIAPQVQPSRVEKQQITPPIAPPSPNTDFVVVTGTSANIRAGAGSEFPIVATVNQGAKLTLLGEYGKWFNVRLEDGKEGWINSRFVQE